MRITVLAGGIGGARFTRGLLHHLASTTTGADVTVVGNTGDDIRLFGLQICPDLDTVMYTLGGGISEERGWGREDETFTSRRSWRPTASSRLVRARGPRHRDPPRPHADARRRATPCPR